VQDDEYIPHGEDIAAFLEREIAKPIIRWEETRRRQTVLGYEILPNKYFYRYQPPTPGEGLLAEFWRLEKEAEKMLNGVIEALKARVANARISAARKVNHELIMLYWDIGRGIVDKQQVLGWGESVVELVAKDLQTAFPGTTGFSVQNVWRMLQFYRTHTAPEFLAQLVKELSKEKKTVPAHENLSQLVREMVATVPWGHHANVMAKLTDPAARIYYLRATAQFGWSRNVLLNQIKAGAYERAVTEKKTHNFPLAMPEYLAEQADEMLKSSYNLEFLGLKRTVKERELEDRLVSRLQAFLLELGYGFCFVGRQYRLALGEKEYFIDLLFYHRFLKALVAFELKVGAFEPEHAGKMDFYLNLLNDKERGPDDQPSIGIILCAAKDDVEVEYALRSKANPIGVAAYALQSKLPGELKGKLPTAKQLADVVRGEMEGGDERRP
jgi:predicted nuclease of restriction endonuclease-like (RecB) superfamily